jgi:hypothetical protein
MTFFSRKNKLITVPLKYGGIGGILVILLFMIFYFLGKNHSLRLSSSIYLYWLYLYFSP